MCAKSCAPARADTCSRIPSRRTWWPPSAPWPAAKATSVPPSPTPCSTIIASTSPTPIDLLTSREREVLQMLAEGKTNKEIAVVLNLSVYTVDAHRGRIMEKLNVHSINELVRFAVRNGLID